MCEFKVYPGGVPGEFLSGDESKLWAYARYLEDYRDDAADRFAEVVRQRDAAEAEVAALKARLEELELELGNAIPAPPDTTGAAAKGKGKGAR